MFGKMGLNLRIGGKLGITSGIGVLLVVAIIISQMIGNGQIREASGNLARNSANALASASSESTVLGIEVAVSSIRLAVTADELKKASDDLSVRDGLALKIADALVQRVKAPAQLLRAQRNRALIDQLFQAAKELAAIKTEVIASRSKDGAGAADRKNTKELSEGNRTGELQENRGRTDTTGQASSREQNRVPSEKKSDPGQRHNLSEQDRQLPVH